MPVNQTRSAKTSKKNIISKFKINSIRVKLILSFSVMIIPIILLGSCSFLKTSNTIESSNKDAFKQTMLQTKKYLELAFKRVETTAKQIYSDSNVQQILTESSFQNNKENSYNFAYLKDLTTDKLLKYRLTDDFIGDINISGTQKSSFISPYYFMDSDMGLSFEKIKASDQYKRVKESPNNILWSGYNNYIEKYKANIGLSETSYQRIYYETIIKSFTSGDEVGFLTLNVRIDSILELLGNINYGKGSELHFVTKDNRDFSFKINSSNNLVKNDSNIKQSLEFLKELKNNNLSENGEYINYKGQQYLLLGSQISKSGILLYSLTPKTNLLEASQSILNLTVVLIIFGIFIAIALGIYISSGMWNAINRVIKVSEKIAQGDLTESIEKKSNDEFGVLADSINRMSVRMGNLIKQTVEIAEMLETSSFNIAISSIQVSELSQYVNDSFIEISKTTTAEAIDANVIVINMSELNSNVQNVSDQNKEIAKLSFETGQCTTKGLYVLEDLNLKSEHVIKKAEDITSNIVDLSHKISSIDDVTGVIDKLSTDIDFLAQSLQKEAIRLGDDGTVVAAISKQFDKLNTVTLIATRKIGKMVMNIKQKIEETVDLTVVNSIMINLQTDALKNTMLLFREIDTFMKSLNNSIDDISKNIIQMEDSRDVCVNNIENISAQIEETSSVVIEVVKRIDHQHQEIESLNESAQELKNVAGDLNLSISTFKLKK